MNGYRWHDPKGRTFQVERSAPNNLVEVSHEEGVAPQEGFLPSAATDELLRLAEENRALKKELASAEVQRIDDVADAEEEQAARIASLEAEVERLRGESVIAVSIQAGEGAERQRIVDYLREAANSDWPGQEGKDFLYAAAERIAAGKKLDPHKPLSRTAPA